MWGRPQDQKIVGAALAKARTHAGVTQQELAKRLRKPQSFVSSYERGQRRVDIPEFLKITQAMGLDPRKVFGVVRAAWLAKATK